MGREMRVSTPKYCTEPFHLIFFFHLTKKKRLVEGFGGSLKVVYTSESFERTKIGYSTKIDNVFMQIRHIILP